MIDQKHNQRLHETKEKKEIPSKPCPECKQIFYKPADKSRAKFKKQKTCGNRICKGKNVSDLMKRKRPPGRIPVPKRIKTEEPLSASHPLIAELLRMPLA